MSKDDIIISLFLSVVILMDKNLVSDSDDVVMLGEEEEYMKPAYIIRKKDNEKVFISKKQFSIGRLESLSDYVVSNPYVSKLHAEIIFDNEEYYIVDHHTTNKTYVDDAECIGDQKIKLENGSKIRIADEIFVFELS